MSAIYYDLPQRSPEWYEARLGIPTASGISALITPTGKKAAGKAPLTYLCQLIAERIGVDESSFSNEWTERGLALEERAISYYQMVTDTEVKQTGIVFKDATYSSSCSPDGLVGDVGGIEIKSLKLENHIKSLVTDEVPADYMTQIQASLWVTGRQWWDFISFHPTVKVFIKRVYPDESRMKAFDSVIADFNKRLDAEYAKIIGLEFNSETTQEAA